MVVVLAVHAEVLVLSMLRRLSFVSVVALVVTVSGSMLTACSSNNYKPPGVALPDKFPINCIPGSECTRADSTPIGQDKYRQIVVLKTLDDTEKVHEFYKTEVVMKGYRLNSDNNRRGAIQMECMSDAAKLDIHLEPVSNMTIISISYDPKLDHVK